MLVVLGMHDKQQPCVIVEQVFVPLKEKYRTYVTRANEKLKGKGVV